MSTTDLVGRMLLMTRQHFRRGPLEYDVGHESSSQLGLDSDARSPYTGCSQFLPTTQKIIQFSDGKSPKVHTILQVEETSDTPGSLCCYCILDENVLKVMQYR